MAIRNNAVELFNVGDRVMVGPRGLENVKSAARQKATVTRVLADDAYMLKFDTNLTNDSHHQITSDRWFAQADEIFPVKTTKPTLADTLQLKPSTRTILSHLEKRGTISPMEALTSYGNMRLAAAIHDLRKVGYDINTTMKHDEGGHSYARYSLAA